MSVPLGKIRAAKKLEFQENHDRGPNHGSWFRGEHTNINPNRNRMISQQAVQKYLIKGWEPREKVINSSTQVTAFGSCFAANISEWLAKRNFTVLNKGNAPKDAYIVACGEGMVNSFVIRQQFEWAWENKIFDQPLWHGYKTEVYGYDTKIQKQTKDIFDQTDVFILTFGLSEVWYDNETKNVFWRAIPKEVYDPKRHKFRVSSVQENSDNLEAIYQLIRKYRPDAKIIFTLSPIPLSATFRGIGCLGANSASKAILRAAIDDRVREHQDENVLHYFPSYELMTDVFQLPYAKDRKHMKVGPLEYAMTLFEHTWCDDAEKPAPSLVIAWAKACADAQLFPKALNECIRESDWDRMRRVLKDKAFDPKDPSMERAYRSLCLDLLDEVGEVSIAG